MIERGVIDPYMNCQIHFGKNVSSFGSAWTDIEELAQTRGTEYELDKEDLYIEDIENFFSWRKRNEEGSRRNIVDFLTRLNQIEEITEINLSCTIKFERA
jgi:hypothetical protein